MNGQCHNHLARCWLLLGIVRAGRLLLPSHHHILQFNLLPSVGTALHRVFVDKPAPASKLQWNFTSLEHFGDEKGLKFVSIIIRYN
jgi:hypothetical protein